MITLQSPGKACTAEQQHQPELLCVETPLGLQGDGDGTLKLHCVPPRTQRALKERVLVTLKYPILGTHMEQNTEMLQSEQTTVVLVIPIKANILILQETLPLKRKKIN